jgi:C4-dicarboxylate-specific signal transduction histidine kinase
MAKENSKRLYREEELAFFGAVTASLSHDLNNAIAIIEQTAGLLEDLILGCEGDQAVAKDQLQRIVDRIGKQTKRSAVIVHRLNAFAHSVDEPEREIDLNDLTENVAALANRMTDRRRARLEIRPSNAAPKIQSNPFRVQQAVYCSLKEALSQAPDGAALILSTGSLDAKAWIEVAGETTADSAAPELSYLEMLMGQLGGSVESTIQDGKLTIRLIFPSR